MQFFRVEFFAGMDLFSEVDFILIAKERPSDEQIKEALHKVHYLGGTVYLDGVTPIGLLDLGNNQEKIFFTKEGKEVHTMQECYEDEK